MKQREEKAIFPTDTIVDATNFSNLSDKCVLLVWRKCFTTVTINYICLIFPIFKIVSFCLKMSEKAWEPLFSDF